RHHRPAPGSCRVSAARNEEEDEVRFAVFRPVRRWVSVADAFDTPPAIQSLGAAPARPGRAPEGREPKARGGRAGGTPR
ncbi:hypothetical protein ACWC5I_10630, partial [Kitasatospora sp. NPDC001574]